MIQSSVGYVPPSYLARLGEKVKKDKQRSYAVAEIGTGNVVLDLGCGSGVDTVALATLVGATGRVVGVDYDQEMIAEADRRATEADVRAWVTHQQADATTLPFPDGTFDVSRSERLFQHLENPAAALAEMVRVTRAGGRVVVMDTDWATLSVDTDEVDIERRLVRFFTDHRHRSGYAGRQLHRLFREAGLREVTAEPRTNSDTSYELLRLAFQFDELEREAVAAGVISDAELVRWRASLEAADAAGGVFGSCTMMLVTGRVSGA